MRTMIFLAGFCFSAGAAPVGVRWEAVSGEVDGYRIYKGDVNGREFVRTTADAKASIDMADGESLFVTSFRGLLESQPSGLLEFEHQGSGNLSLWVHPPQTQPAESRYFTRFKVLTSGQPAAVAPNNPAFQPPTPVDPGLDPAPGSAPPAEETRFEALGIRDLPTPWIIAHRGGRNVAPEHTLEAYRMCVASGIRFIEPDVQVLPDGTVVVMHDTRIDKTTNGMGLVSAQTAGSWETLRNDDGSRLPGWATNLRCPTFDDVLREFGNRVVIVPEGKNTGAVAAIVAKLQEFNIRKDMVIIQSPHLTELAHAVAAGYPCMRMSRPNYAETINAGIEFTGFGWNETAKIQAATAAGLKVIVWTTVRNWEMESALAAGAIAVFSDEPVYQAGMHRARHDRYGSKAFYHGEIRSTRVTLDGAESAIIVSTKQFAGIDAVLLGWASPVVEPESFVLDFSMKFADVSTDAAYGMISIQTTDKAVVSEAPEAGKRAMNVMMRRDGRMEIKVSDGADGGPGIVSSENPVLAELVGLDMWVPLRLSVTPTSVTLKRLDMDVSATMENNQIRGAYLFAGSKGANVKFRAMTLDE